MKATLEWVLQQPYKSHRDASTFGKIFLMPDVGNNELRIIFLKRLGYGFKAISKQIGLKPNSVRRWLIKAGFDLVAGKESPAHAFRWEAYKAKQDASKRLKTKNDNTTFGKWEDEWRGVVECYYALYEIEKLKKRRILDGVARRYHINKNIPAQRMKRICRLRVLNAIKRQNPNARKRAKTEQLIGCTWQQLVAHIENQFTDGMNWLNRGDWHIDHIIPCSLFDLASEQGQRDCFHYSNLRPLWAHDNWSRPKDGSDLLAIKKLRIPA